MRCFVDAREYKRAYELAGEQALSHELEQLFRRRLPYLEANGMFEDCAWIEALMGNEKMAENYSGIAEVIQS